jgi:RimJ/RimL family protein N-acetyltransferase
VYDHKNGCSFRKLDREDLGLLKTLKEDSWTTTHRVAFVNADDQEKWFDSTPANVQHFLCYRTEESTLVRRWPDRKECCRVEIPVGLLTITTTDPVTQVAQIGGSIFADHRGTDWSRKAWEAGTDFAFEMFNFHRIDGEVLENNLAALAMDVKLGYKIEGVRRRAVYKSGTYLDSYVVGFLRHEWEMSVLNRYSGICNLNYKPRLASEKLLERLGVEMPEEITIVSQVPPEIHLDGPSAEDVQKYAQAVS